MGEEHGGHRVRLLGATQIARDGMQIMTWLSGLRCIRGASPLPFGEFCALGSPVLTLPLSVSGRARIQMQQTQAIRPPHPALSHFIINLKIPALQESDSPLMQRSREVRPSSQTTAECKKRESWPLPAQGQSPHFSEDQQASQGRAGLGLQSRQWLGALTWAPSHVHASWLQENLGSPVSSRWG